MRICIQIQQALINAARDSSVHARLRNLKYSKRCVSALMSGEAKNTLFALPKTQAPSGGINLAWTHLQQVCAAPTKSRPSRPQTRQWVPALKSRQG